MHTYNHHTTQYMYIYTTQYTYKYDNPRAGRPRPPGNGGGEWRVMCNCADMPDMPDQARHARHALCRQARQTSRPDMPARPGQLWRKTFTFTFILDFLETRQDKTRPLFHGPWTVLSCLLLPPGGKGVRWWVTREEIFLFWSLVLMRMEVPSCRELYVCVSVCVRESERVRERERERAWVP